MSFFESIKKFENKIGEKILFNLNCFINDVQNLKIYNNDININNKNVVEVYDEIKNSKKLKNLLLFNKNNKNKCSIYSKNKNNKNNIELINFFNKNKILFKNNNNNIFNKLDNIKPIIIQNIKNNIKTQLNKKILSNIINIRKRNNNNNNNYIQIKKFFSKTKIPRNNNNNIIINNENINLINDLKSPINKKLNKVSSCKNINNNIIIKKLNVLNTKNKLLYRNKSNTHILNGLKTNGIISPRILKSKFQLHYKINSL